MHRLIAAKVQADPALLDKARDNLRRWQEMEGSPKLALTEWEQILSASVSQVAQFLTDPRDPPSRPARSRAF